MEGDDTLEKVDVETFQLNLAEGPQVMILSVELDDEQPVDSAVGRHVLNLVEQQFSDKN